MNGGKPERVRKMFGTSTLKTQNTEAAIIF
jgi:hypothetical protein